MKDGGYFYPNKRDKGSEWSDGITRRDWLAGLAMQSMLSNPISAGWEDKRITVNSYSLADAMIKEGAK